MPMNESRESAQLKHVSTELGAINVRGAALYEFVEVEQRL
jgi:hypothetical protein